MCPKNTSFEVIQKYKFIKNYVMESNPVPMYI